MGDVDQRGLRTGEDGVARCFWCGEDDLYVRYHDQEWGRPVDSDRRLFEKICLEGFQSGLSWITILRKRENFRAAFANFELETVAQFGDAEVAALLQNAGIVRHRKKIESTINNARRALEMVEEFGSLAAWFWQYQPDPDTRPDVLNRELLRTMSRSPESTRMAKDLKKRGWSFVGPTTAYSFMQSVGLVNDHLTGCALRSKVDELRTDFVIPA